jgi:LmbE family N-acetylglucosaminyl deacetylase
VTAQDLVADVVVDPASPLGSRVLIVSPHLDDAVLSALSIVHSSAADEVLTVFAGTPDPPVITDWDVRCGFDDSTEAMHVRHAEDDLAFDGLPVRRRSLELLDSHYRDDGLTEESVKTLVAAIDEWRRDENDVVALPAGAGGPLRLLERIRLRIPIPKLGLPGGAPPHQDHLWVTDVVLAALPSVRCVLYEEIPYAWVRRADDRVAALARTHHRAVSREMSIPVDVVEKARRVSAYQSQLDGILGPSMRDLTSVIEDRERMWMLEPAPPGF